MVAAASGIGVTDVVAFAVFMKASPVSVERWLAMRRSDRENGNDPDQVEMRSRAPLC
jgi:hypothetical protein